MPTTNPTITAEWSLIVPAGADFMLAPPWARQLVFVAIGTADNEGNPEAPAADMVGHVLAPGYSPSLLDRGNTGPGPLYARLGDATDPLTLAVTTWTPAA